MIKMLFTNLFPIVLVITGILQVYYARQDNYGCGGVPPISNPPDSGWYYVLFCILLVTYALELLVFPAIATNRIMRWIRSNELTQKNLYATKAKGERLEQCLGGLLKCISVLCCNKAGGKELNNQGEMKDFASNLVSLYS